MNYNKLFHSILKESVNCSINEAVNCSINEAYLLQFLWNVLTSKKICFRDRTRMANYFKKSILKFCCKLFINYNISKIDSYWIIWNKWWIEKIEIVHSFILINLIKIWRHFNIKTSFGGWNRIKYPIWKINDLFFGKEKWFWTNSNLESFVWSLW
jgi:hypothetical protein